MKLVSNVRLFFVTKFDSTRFVSRQGRYMFNRLFAHRSATV